MSTPTKCRVLVRKLGKIRYSAALDLQQRTARTYKDNILCGECISLCCISLIVMVGVVVGVSGEVLLCEHYPVFTFGLREKDYQTRVADLQKVGGGCEVVKVSEFLSSLYNINHTLTCFTGYEQIVYNGLLHVKVRRGGLTTFHGPGQLVCYPVLNLRKLKVSQLI